MAVGSDRTTTIRFAALFLLSATLIGYELAVMRAFSVGSWSNFGAMVISIALLGFGLAGTLLTFVQKSIRQAPQRWLSVLALAFVPAMALAHVLAQQVPFNPVMIVSDSRQILWIGCYYLIYVVPFFIGALFINASFVIFGQHIHRLYFWNMAGSGLGGLFIIVFMYLLPPASLTVPLLILGGLAAALVLVESGPSGRIRITYDHMIMLSGVVLISVIAVLMGGAIRVSEFKGISYARSFPDARVTHHSFSPIGEMYVYSSSYFHFAPGLSDTASLNLEKMPQEAFRGLYIDGGGPIGVMRSLAEGEKRYMDYLPMTAPYLLLDHPKVMLVGLGGGISAFTALYHQADRVTVLESNTELVRLLRDDPEFVRYNDGLLDDPRVEVVSTQPRAYAARAAGAYDLVEISLIDSVGLSQAGGYSVDPNFTYTSQAITDYMKGLGPEGYLSVTVWNKLNPPRNVPKLLSTIVDSLESQGIDHPERRVFAFHLLLSTATVIVKNGDFTAQETQKLRDFCRRMSFSVIHYPGIEPRPGDLRQMLKAYNDLYTVTPERIRNVDGGLATGSAGPRARSPVPSSDEFYHHATEWLLSGRGRELWDGYVFNVRPATDERPFYTAYLKPGGIRHFFDQLGSVSEEWGYLLLLATLLQSLIFGALIVVIPLAGRWRDLFRGRQGTVGIIIYYACLGLGYMLVEIFLIQRMSYFVAEPIFAVSIVITSMLILSGLGSLFASRRFAGRRTRAVRFAALGVGATLLFYLVLLSPLINSLIGLPLAVRVLITILLVAPSAFFMGIPFPTGLSALEDGGGRLIPWAMGMNGALSVTGAVGAKLLSISWGFPSVLLLAVLLYAVAAFVFPANTARSA